MTRAGRSRAGGPRLTLADFVHTFGQDLLRRYVERVHKLAIDAGFTCPNRDGTKGRGGCAFCNNASFSPNARRPRPDRRADRRTVRACYASTHAACAAAVDVPCAVRA